MRYAALLLAVLMVSGCVTGRRVMPLPVPATGDAAATKAELYLAPIEDARNFEDSPSSPSTPSARHKVASLTPEDRQVLVGRQRNGFGRAMGDIALGDGQTVSERMRQLLKQGFAKRGYALTDNAQAANAATVKVQQFWGWSMARFADVAFEANIEAVITIKSGDKTREVHVSGHGQNSGQVAKNANWQLAFERAYEDFLAKLDAELDHAGL